MKSLSFENKTFTVDNTAYADTIKELSQIIGRSDIVTFKAFEKLQPEQVAGILEDSKRWSNNGFQSQAMAVWCARKKLL